MLKHKFRGTVRNGKLVITDRPAFDKHVAAFPEGTELGMTLSKARKDRSDRQNAYYWAVVLKVISDHTGHSTEELHEIFKRMFLPPRLLTFKGKTYEVPISTADQDTMEFTDYIERIRAEAGTMGITVPDPDQIHF